GAPSLLINGRFFRAFGTFGQPNPFGGFMGLLIPLVLMLLLAYLRRIYHQYQAGQRLSVIQVIPAATYGLSSVLMIAAIFASWSRGAWLGLIIALGVMLFVLPRKLWQSILLAGTLCILVATMWTAGLLPQSVTARIASSTEEFFIFDDVRGVTITPENYAVVERLAHWQAALNMTREHPWLGVGLGNYEIVYEQYRLMAWQPPLGHAHNYYLNIFAEAGLFGLLSYLFLWSGMFYITWRARQHPDFMMRYLCIGLLGTWTYLMVHSLLDNLYVNNIFLHLGVLIGLVLLVYQQISSTEQ
ncbi:MAG: O-antigen ligase family protein, partial [Aggregatilineales bacterium]